MAFDRVSEAAYLTAQNVGIYRGIMRVFFEEYEKMHYQMYASEVYELFIKKYPSEAVGYDLDHMKADLDALTEWKNLTPIQDPRRVYTIAEYKNKQYRYSMTDAAVEIERMVERIENLYIEPATLSTNHFIRIEKALSQLGEVVGWDLKSVNEWWQSLQEDFRVLNQNYKDYLREFYSGRSEKILRSMEFVIHKDRFIEYLNDFVRELQIHSTRIVPMLVEISYDVQESLLSRITEGELSVPRPGLDTEDPDYRKMVANTIEGRWETLCNFFLPHNGKRSESERILDVTNDIIEKIIKNASLIMQLQNIGISKKNEYKNYIRMFLDCDDIEAAHKLSAHIFGVSHIIHYVSHGERSTDSITSSVSNENPEEVLIYPHTRSYRPRMEKTGFSDKRLEKEAQRQRVLKRIASERELADRYISDGRIVISGIEGIVPESFRIILLSWIAAAGANESGMGTTQYGRTFTLIRHSGETALECEDGKLFMPDYELVFEDES